MPMLKRDKIALSVALGGPALAIAAFAIFWTPPPAPPAPPPKTAAEQQVDDAIWSCVPMQRAMWKAEGRSGFGNTDWQAYRECKKYFGQ